jgi:signal transduction histidine kinase/ActR/RegA family two-component response regulator
MGGTLAQLADALVPPAPLASPDERRRSRRVVLVLLALSVFSGASAAWSGQHGQRASATLSLLAGLAPLLLIGGLRAGLGRTWVALLALAIAPSLAMGRVVLGEPIDLVSLLWLTLPVTGLLFARVALPRTLTELADRIVPPRGEPGSLERFRGRAMTMTLVLASFAAITTAPAYLIVGMWLTAAYTLGFGALMFAGTAIYRRGVSTETGFFLLLFSAAAYVFAAASSETPLEFGSMAWGLVFPMTGFLLVGVRGGVWGSVVMCALVIATILLHQDHAWQAPITQAVLVVRLTALTVAVVLLAATSEVLRDQAMEESLRATRAKTLFLANMSHELRTPMNGVLGLTELLMSTSLTDEQREQLGLIDRSGRALVAIIDDILHLTKVESGGLTLERLRLDLRALATDVVELHRPNALRKGLALTLEWHESAPPQVELDPTRLRQILSNLVGNAVKFTEAGQVTLRVREGPEGSFCVAVEDTGIGIPLEARTRLFTPFHQVDATFTRRFGGTGLGLALSRQLALAMGGEVTVESAPGRGSTFTVTLPLELSGVPLSAERPPVSAPRPSAPPAEVARWPVLVVDDNPINLRVARGLVERLGYTVETATNGREAVTALSTHRYRFVLMDCHMPELDGLDATREVRASPGPSSKVPIIALTASVLPEDVEACLRAGMNVCLAKPVTLAHLERAIDEACRPPPVSPG